MVAAPAEPKSRRTQALHCRSVDLFVALTPVSGYVLSYKENVANGFKVCVSRAGIFFMQQINVAISCIFPTNLKGFFFTFAHGELRDSRRGHQPKVGSGEKSGIINSSRPKSEKYARNPGN